jgi:putative endonuclease
MERTYYVYILANRLVTTLYIGVTTDLLRRVHEHKTQYSDGFTNWYNLGTLVYYEERNDMRSAIQLEKQLKWWHRQWKIDLIKTMNPRLIDLAEGWYDGDVPK